MTLNPQGSNRRGPGRPPLRTALVEGIECSDHARERLAAILETISGAMTVVEACARLGINESRFHAMRAQYLSESAQLLEPRARGPAPKSEADAEAQRKIEELERANAELARDLCASQAREELALSMPERMRAVKKRGAPQDETPASEVKHRWKKRRRASR